jgi:hypothetical protein
MSKIFEKKKHFNKEDLWIEIKHRKKNVQHHYNHEMPLPPARTKRMIRKIRKKYENTKS